MQHSTGGGANAAGSVVNALTNSVRNAAQGPEGNFALAAQADAGATSRHHGRSIRAVLLLATALALGACTQESQNAISRSIQNWTGTNGVLEIYAGNTLVKRFMKIDKLSTAMGTSDGLPRSYRYGYGVLDANLNAEADPGESKVYFEVSDYATFYVFYEQPKK